MHKLLFILLITLPHLLWAESTMVRPFRLEFMGPEDRYQLRAQIHQSCRYEMWVVGDSSEYHEIYKTHELTLKSTKQNEHLLYEVALDKSVYLELKGIFKPYKECKSELVLHFTDKNFSIGWAGQFSRPISFSISTSEYFRAGNSELDISSLTHLVDQQFIDFVYVGVPGLQVNIWMSVNGGILSSVSPVSSAIDASTQMPYRLKK